MKKTQHAVICRFNGADPLLIAEINAVAGREADGVHQAFPQKLDKTGVRAVTVVTYNVDSKEAEGLAGKFTPLLGVEVLIERETK